MTTPMVSVPVAAILARKLVQGARWSVPNWHAVAVVAGERLAGSDARGELVRTGGAEEHFLWGGLTLELYRDAAQAYWENLTGENPALFVVCHEVGNGELRPVTVTADQNQAIAGTEGDERVYPAPIPPELYQRIEQFIIEHHRPKPVRKRKRANWSADSE